MSAPARARRRSLVVVVVVVVAGLVLGAGVTAYIAAEQGPSSSGREPGQESAMSSSTAAPVAPVAGSTPGCHAGAAITNAALVASRESTPMTAEGAASFAADLFRWLGTDPTPDQADELASTIAQILAPNADGGLRQVLASAVEDARRGAAGDDWHVSTEGGRYYLESSSDEQTVVSVSATRVFDDGNRQSGTQTFVLAPADSGWQLVALTHTRTTADLQSVGTPYLEGC